MTATPIIDKVNATLGIVVAILSYVLGEHWILFVGFLCLNIADWVTGMLKARLSGKSSSKKGTNGVIKKLGYWIMIMIAFGMGAIFIEIGKTIGVDLHVSTMIGYFVLASLIVNEFRSILENFVESGYKVPYILTKGLEVANKAVDIASGEKENEEGS